MTGKITREDAKQTLDERLAVGMSIARRHLTPFVKELVKEHKYNRLEMASALLILAYNMVRKGKPILESRRMFNVLARGAGSLIEEGGSSRLH